MVKNHLTNTSDIGIIKFNPLTHQAIYSKGFQSVVPVKNLDPVGLESLISFFPAEDGTTLRFLIDDCITHKTPYQAFIKSGKLKVTAHPFESGPEPDVLISFIKTDVLEKSLDIENERTNLRLKLSLAATKTGVWDWDYTNNRLYWDSTMFELFEINPQSFTGTFDDLKDIIDQTDIMEMTNKILVAVDSGEEFVNTFRINTPSGQKFIAARGRVDTSKLEGIWFTGINWDVTSEVRKSEIIKLQETKIFASARLSSLGEMAGGIAHEINNPLAIIQAKAEFLKKRIGHKDLSNETIETGLDKIIETCSRIVGIIKGLRSFSRNSENDPFIAVPIRCVVDDVLGLISEKIKMNAIQLDVNIPQELIVSGRPAQLGQVFMNLISNSYDSIVAQDEKWIRINASPIKDGKIEIRVMDSGSGIHGDIQARIMQPFFTTKEVGKGTGLGLSIAKGIIEDHAGKLWLDADSPRTCFVIELPLQK
jgi:signal transduction histidine kinase